MSNKFDPYEICPTFETEHFIYRLVCQDDAIHLLECYRDPIANRIFNSDNCLSGFYVETIEKMRSFIDFWLKEYEQKYYIRFSILDKNDKKAIGTIEFFARNEVVNDYGKIGILRVDLSTRYEKFGVITEILQLVDDTFYECFSVDGIATKAIPLARQRILALEKLGYQEFNESQIIPYDDYYIKVRH